MEANDPRLIEELRKNILTPPSEQPYNFTQVEREYYRQRLRISPEHQLNSPTILPRYRERKRHSSQAEQPYNFSQEER